MNNPIAEFLGQLLQHSTDAIASPPTPQLSSKAGGYPDEMFTSPLSDEERAGYECSICYLIARRAKTCRNKHRFCSTCIHNWSLTSQTNSGKCPVCRCDGPFTSLGLAPRLANLSVICPHSPCTWTGLLVSYKLHRHGHSEEEEIDALQERAASHAQQAQNQLPVSVAEFFIRTRQAQLQTFLDYSLDLMRALQESEETAAREQERRAAADVTAPSTRARVPVPPLTPRTTSSNQVSSTSTSSGVPRPSPGNTSNNSTTATGANTIVSSIEDATIAHDTNNQESLDSDAIQTTATGPSNALSEATQPSAARSTRTTRRSSTTASQIPTAARRTSVVARQPSQGSTSGSRTTGSDVSSTGRAQNPRSIVRARRLNANQPSSES